MTSVYIRHHILMTSGPLRKSLRWHLSSYDTNSISNWK